MSQNAKIAINFLLDFRSFGCYKLLQLIFGIQRTLAKKIMISSDTCTEDFKNSRVGGSDLRSRVWIVARPTVNDSTRLYKNGDISIVKTLLERHKARCEQNN